MTERAEGGSHRLEKFELESSDGWYRPQYQGQSTQILANTAGYHESYTTVREAYPSQSSPEIVEIVPSGSLIYSPQVLSNRKRVSSKVAKRAIRRMALQTLSRSLSAGESLVNRALGELNHVGSKLSEVPVVNARLKQLQLARQRMGLDGSPCRTTRFPAVRQYSMPIACGLLLGFLGITMSYQLERSAQLAEQYQEVELSFSDIMDGWNGSFNKHAAKKVAHKKGTTKLTRTSLLKPKLFGFPQSEQAKRILAKIESSLEKRGVNLAPEADQTAKNLNDLKVVEQVFKIISKFSKNKEQGLKLANRIVAESRRNNYDPLFVAAVIKSESGFNHLATSHVGAKGLMQIMPDTGRFMERLVDAGPRPAGFLTDPGYNLKLGINYLKHLDEQFNGNKVLTLIAYNWGPGKVQRTMQGRIGGVPKEVMNYALKILHDHNTWRKEVSKRS